MKHFYARKIFQYDPTEGSKYSKYIGYSLSASKRTNPHILSSVHIELPEKYHLSILSSPLTRARETSKVISIQRSISQIIYFDELEEITFNMHKLLTEEEFIQYGSDLVRERFIEAFIANDLDERRTDVKYRIDNLFTKLQKLHRTNYIIISHSFLLKLIQIYLKLGNQLFDEPQSIKQYFNPKVKTFYYGSGFDFIFDERSDKIELI